MIVIAPHSPPIELPGDSGPCHKVAGMAHSLFRFLLVLSRGSGAGSGTWRSSGWGSALSSGPGPHARRWRAGGRALHAGGMIVMPALALSWASRRRGEADLPRCGRGRVVAGAGDAGCRSRNPLLLMNVG